MKCYTVRGPYGCPVRVSVDPKVSSLIPCPVPVPLLGHSTTVYTPSLPSQVDEVVTGVGRVIPPPDTRSPEVLSSVPQGGHGPVSGGPSKVSPVGSNSHPQTSVCRFGEGVDVPVTVGVVSVPTKSGDGRIHPTPAKEGNQ